MDRLPGAFGLTDLLAYHFPGFLAATAVVLMRAEWSVAVVEFGARYPVPFAALVIVLPYVIGVLVSGVTGALMRRSYGGWLAKSTILQPLALCEEVIRSKLVDIVGKQQERNLARLDEFPANLPLFYLCRALVRDHMPRTYVSVDRQNALRQFRRNLIIPLVLVGIAALCFVQNQGGSFVHYLWIVAVTAVAVLSTIRSATLSRQREIRETFLGFLASRCALDRTPTVAAGKSVVEE